MVSTVLHVTCDNNKLTPAAMWGQDCWAHHESAPTPARRWDFSLSVVSSFPCRRLSALILISFRSSMYWVWDKENPPSAVLLISTPHCVKESRSQVPHLNFFWIWSQRFFQMGHDGDPANKKSSTCPPTSPTSLPSWTYLKQHGSHTTFKADG